MRRKALLLVGSLPVIAIAVLASVAVASGSANHPIRSRAGSARPGMGKVLGYKHTPGQVAMTASSARSRARHATAKVNRTLIANFALLRRAQSRSRARTADASSQTTVAAAIAPLTALHKSYAADPSQAGETTIGPGNDAVWLVPGSTGACLVDVEGPQGAGSTCNATNAVDVGQLWTIDTIPYGHDGAMTKVLIGTAPDGNSSVTVAWAGGGSTVVPVTDNIYSVPIGSHAGWTSVTLKNSSGDTATVPGMSKLP